MPSTNSTLPEGRRGVLLIATIVRRAPHALPLAEEAQNASYAHLAALCARRGIDLYLTHHDNLAGATRALAWAWRDGAWQCEGVPLSEMALCYADLPENFSGARDFRRALAVHPITLVNDLRLSDLLTDKLATYQRFPDHVPPTWIADEPGLDDRLRGLRLHHDLDVDRIVLKPRYGERGRGIFVIEADHLLTHPALGSSNYVAQAFLETGSGIPALGLRGRHDLRLIVRHGEIVLAFARLPAAGSYIANCSAGGHEIPLDVADLPVDAVRLAAAVDARLSAFGPRLYSLDLGVGQSGKFWIYELNTMPGIVWDEALPVNKAMHATMHQIVADWLDAASRPTPAAVLAAPS